MWKQFKEDMYYSPEAIKEWFYYSWVNKIAPKFIRKWWCLCLSGLDFEMEGGGAPDECIDMEEIIYLSCKNCGKTSQVTIYQMYFGGWDGKMV